MHHPFKEGGCTIFIKFYQSPGDGENKVEYPTEGLLVRGDSLDKQPVADDGYVAGQPHHHLPGEGGWVQIDGI